MTKRYGRVVFTLLLWAVLCLGLPALAEALNGLKPGGTPLGLAIVGQASPLLLVLAAVMLGKNGRPDTASAHRERDV